MGNACLYALVVVVVTQSAIGSESSSDCDSGSDSISASILVS